jgi:hypothetical protein
LELSSEVIRLLQPAFDRFIQFSCDARRKGDFTKEQRVNLKAYIKAKREGTEPPILEVKRKPKGMPKKKRSRKSAKKRVLAKKRST